MDKKILLIKLDNIAKQLKLARQFRKAQKPNQTYRSRNVKSN